MTTDLRDGLHHLADHERAAAPPSDLWDRGVRRLRRRRVGAAGVALAVLAVGGTTGAVVSDVVRNDAAQPVSTDHPGAIPDRLDTPSAWTPSTADKGPLGPVALVAGAEHRSGLLGSSSNGVVGVSAQTGEYRFLDLPGRLESGGMVTADAPPAVSSDGRRVAYWVAGEQGGSTVVTGVASYDTETDETTVEPIETDKGAIPEDLTWLEDGRLLYVYSTITQIDEAPDGGSMSGTLAAPRLWTPSADDTVVLDDPAPRGGSSFAPTADGFVSLNGRRLGLWRGIVLVATHKITGAQVNTWQVSPDGTRVVVTTQEDRKGRSEVLVGHIPDTASGDIRVEQVAGVDPVFRPATVLGWRDDNRVIVEGHLADARASSFGAYALDLRTGDVVDVVAQSQVNWDPGHAFASDLWEHDTVTRPLPPHILDPRLSAAGGAFGAAVLAGLVVLLVRRRRAKG